jgi:hypothetical protein
MCASPGPDMAYDVFTVNGGEVDANLNSEYDSVILGRESCVAKTQFACNNGFGNSSSLSFGAQGGEHTIIWADAFLTGGAHRLILSQ